MIDDAGWSRPPQRGSSDRAFGLTFSIFFLFITLSPLRYRDQPLYWWALFIAVLLGVIAHMKPALLSAPNKVWTAYGNVMHRLASLVVLTVLFFGVIMPFGLILRLLRYDPLRLRREPAVATYWIARSSGTPTRHRLHKQY